MWVVLAIFSAVFSALYYLSAQNIKIDKHSFMVYRGFFIAIVLSPILWLYPIVFPFYFYVTSILQGLIAAWVDYLAFGINKKYGASTVSSIMPFSVVIVFVMWLIIDTDLLKEYIQNPFQFVLILISLCGVIFSLVVYHHSHFTKSAFTALFPILFLSSCFNILCKKSMHYSTDHTVLCACYNSLIVALIVGIIHVYIYHMRKLSFQNLISLRNLKKSFIFLLALCGIIFKSLAMYQTQNPAYVQVVLYTSLVWVMFFEHFIKIFKFHNPAQQTSKKWKLLFVLSVMLLILVTNH